MGSLPPDASSPISLAAQQGHLLRRYPASRVVRRRERLVWSGTLTPADYTATYELLIDHQIGKPPLVYVVRPRLRLVNGQGLPHVYPLNTLCLFLGHREWHESIPIADTLVPWASEWLLFYELWLGHRRGMARRRSAPSTRTNESKRTTAPQPRGRLQAHPAHHSVTAHLWAAHRSRGAVVQREADAELPDGGHRHATDMPAISQPQ
jgi:hypothetical protein